MTATQLVKVSNCMQLTSGCDVCLNVFLRLFLRDHPGKPVPEENFWTLWCKGRLTEADTQTIRLGATPSGLTSAHLHRPPYIFTGRMPFLPPNQQRQSTEGKALKEELVPCMIVVKCGLIKYVCDCEWSRMVCSGICRTTTWRVIVVCRVQRRRKRTRSGVSRTWWVRFVTISVSISITTTSSALVGRSLARLSVFSILRITLHLSFVMWAIKRVPLVSQAL